MKSKQFSLLFKSASQLTYERYTVNDFGDIFDHPDFRRNVRTAIFSYGNLQSLRNPNVQEVIETYIQMRTFNFIAVDYSLSWILDGVGGDKKLNY